MRHGGSATFTTSTGISCNGVALREKVAHNESALVNLLLLFELCAPTESTPA